MATVRTIVAAHDDDAEICRTAQEAIELVGRRWVAVVLIGGYLGARRFTEYRRFAAGISDRVLSQRLRELEQRGLIERTGIPSTPVQVTYAPTARGAGLVVALKPLADWWLEPSADVASAGSRTVG
ncbi:winged helix-turn-helix transcriptional regulator [Modestobacter sp. I12A-02662]|uniref:winged helix-turn-helix transcriptional regulator n=1 Tax=Modestobacter sp. I12A-02662 TaxID=1730496 RepID=UPI0034DE02BE